MKLRKDERGVVAVTVALCMVILSAFIAMVADAGMLYLERQKLSNAVDAAALAAVQLLPEKPDAAVQVAKDYAVSNKLALSEMKTVVSANAREITVYADREVKLHFSRVIGISSATVHARSRARVSPIGAVSGAVPFSVVKQDFIFGELYTLKYGAGGEGVYHGNYGALAFMGPGASSYRDDVKYGYHGKLYVGQWVSTEPGNMSGPTEQGVEFRISNCPHYPKCTYDNVKRGCPKLVVIPVIDSLETNGRGEVLIVGFAMFFLEGVLGSGKDSAVQGRFIKFSLDDMAGNGQDFGLRSYGLVE